MIGHCADGQCRGADGSPGRRHETERQDDEPARRYHQPGRVTRVGEPVPQQAVQSGGEDRANHRHAERLPGLPTGRGDASGDACLGTGHAGHRDSGDDRVYRAVPDAEHGVGRG